VRIGNDRMSQPRHYAWDGGYKEELSSFFVSFIAVYIYIYITIFQDYYHTNRNQTSIKPKNDTPHTPHHHLRDLRPLQRLAHRPRQPPRALRTLRSQTLLPSKPSHPPNQNIVSISPAPSLATARLSLVYSVTSVMTSDHEPIRPSRCGLLSETTLCLQG